MEADLPKWEKSVSMSPEEKNWLTGHLHGQLQYGQPDITTMAVLRGASEADSHRGNGPSRCGGSHQQAHDKLDTGVNSK